MPTRPPFSGATLARGILFEKSTSVAVGQKETPPKRGSPRFYNVFGSNLSGSIHPCHEAGRGPRGYSLLAADMRAMKLSNEFSQTRNHRISSLRKGRQLS